MPMPSKQVPAFWPPPLSPFPSPPSSPPPLKSSSFLTPMASPPEMSLLLTTVWKN
uniref:Uncharacterized protein n=1 Tax=Cucumis melo TaxID=3656 RepID=A0A9I9CD93_CUCME